MPHDPALLAGGSALVGAVFGLWRSRPSSSTHGGQGVRRPARRDDEDPE